MFMGPFSEGGDWNDKGITGIARFVEKFFLQATSKDLVSDAVGLHRMLHRTIKKVTEDIEKFHFNTAISALMEFVNAAHKTGIDNESKRTATRLLAPLAPHLAEEIWEALGEPFSIFDSGWPEFDPSLIVENVLHLAVQVNGKLRGQIEVAADMAKEDILAAARRDPNVARHLEGARVLKEIYVPGKLVSLVVK
jgi:leucyl-tRNA synthetase